MARPRYIVGISAYYHDSAASILRDGRIVAAAHEERFSRTKHDARFPQHAVEYCLSAAGITMRDVEAVVYYDKPFLKFERILETALATIPNGMRQFTRSMPVWLKEKLFLKQTLRNEFSAMSGVKTRELPPLFFTTHHQSHAASAFFASPYPRAAVLCADGVGEWATTTVWRGEGNRLVPLWQMNFPHSLGLLYSAFTQYTGFKVNSGEYKLMGLAPYGEPVYVQTILDSLIDLKPDGTFRLNMDYFGYISGTTMINDRFCALFGGPPRPPESHVTTREMNIAASIQRVTEEVMLRLSRTIHLETGEKYLCMAGGVALNCVANGRILREGPFADLWIQPASGDAGGALGAALSYWHEYCGAPRTADGVHDQMSGAYLGPEWHTDEIAAYLRSINAKAVRYPNAEALCEAVASVLTHGAVVGWFSGRMEYGPRALGARSILGDPRSSDMQTLLNLKIKFRESFRPFAPIVLAEDAVAYFEIDRDSPYMMLTAAVRDTYRRPRGEGDAALVGLDKLKAIRSSLPAITHVDYSARLQTVHHETNPRLHMLLSAWKRATGCSVLINTSFNVRGEPIVCTPQDAYACFMRTNMDYLVMEDMMLHKSDQPGARAYAIDEIEKLFPLD